MGICILSPSFWVSCFISLVARLGIVATYAVAACEGRGLLGLGQSSFEILWCRHIRGWHGERCTSTGGLFVNMRLVS